MSMCTRPSISDWDKFDWENESAHTPSISTMPNYPTIPSTSANYLPAAHREARKPNEVSWFRLEILFCDSEVKDHVFHYDPIAIRKQQSTKSTIIFCLDRKESPEQNREDLLTLIQVSHPRARMKRGTQGYAIHGVRVRSRYDAYEKAEPGITVRVSGLIEQLRQTETYGLEAVSPDLFGTGGNEVHLLMRNEAEDWEEQGQDWEEQGEEEEEQENYDDGYYRE